MAVETPAWDCTLLEYGILVEVLEIALIDADIASHLVAWLDAPIGQSPLVEGGFAHPDVKIPILCPFPVLLYTDRHRDLPATVLHRQVVPVVDAEVCEVAGGMYLSALASPGYHIHPVYLLINDIEVEWGDICRNRHTDIVGIDLRQTVYCTVLRLFASRQLPTQAPIRRLIIAFHSATLVIITIHYPLFTLHSHLFSLPSFF